MRITAIVLLVSCCVAQPAAFAAIGVTVDSGTLGTFASDGIDQPAGVNHAAGFAMNGVTQTATDGSAKSSATYNWTNSSSQAVFESNITKQHFDTVGHTYNYQEFAFTLTQTVNFSLAGRIVGEAGDEDTYSYLYVELSNQAGLVIGREFDYARGTAFDQSIDGVRQGNRDYGFQGVLSGEIGPGKYYFLASVAIQSGSSGDGMAAKGFTRLTLSDPNAAVPEPATLTMWGLGALGCAVAAYRRRRMKA